MLAFSAATCVTLPGYVLNFFPGLALVAGAAVARFARRQAVRLGGLRAGIITGIGVLGINCFVFLAPPSWTSRVRTGLPLTAAELRERDQQLGRVFELIRSRYRPGETLICHHLEYFFLSFRHFQYHLPKYDNALLTPDTSFPGKRGKQLWFGHQRQTELVDRLELRPYATLLLVVPPFEKVNIFQSHWPVDRAEVVPGSGGTLYELPAQSR
jgi:hypothetical protein